jgi:hypothetical protein
MKKALAFLTTVYLCITLFSCCNDSVSSGSNIVFPESNVSYINHVYPFINITCAYQGCHSSTSQAAGRIMDDYYSLVYDINNLGLVVPGKADSSLLVQILDGRIPHNPLISWKVNDNQRAGIKKWIAEGAKNN